MNHQGPSIQKHHHSPVAAPVEIPAVKVTVQSAQFKPGACRAASFGGPAALFHYLARWMPVTAVLDALERRRLVRRYPNPASRRSVLVEATGAGSQACTEILRRLHALEAEWLAGMAEPDRQTLLRLLGQAKGLLSRAQVPPRPGAVQDTA